MEKRAMQRFNLSLKAILSFTDAPTRELETKDISSGGAFFETPETMPEGTRVFISIFPIEHDDHRLDRPMVEYLKGVVTRCDRDGMAIAFDRQHHFIRMAGVS